MTSGDQQTSGVHFPVTVTVFTIQRSSEVDNKVLSRAPNIHHSLPGRQAPSDTLPILSTIQSTVSSI